MRGFHDHELDEPQVMPQERTDGMPDTAYYRITDKTLSIFNWIHPESKYNIEFRYPLSDFPLTSEELKEYLDIAIGHIRDMYGSPSSCIDKIDQSFMSITEAPSSMPLNIQLTDAALDHLLQKLMSGASALTRSIEESRSYLRNYIGARQLTHAAQMGYRLMEHKIKLHKLEEMIDAISALRIGAISEAFINENNNFFDYCIKALDSQTIKIPNSSTGRQAKDKETKWQYKLSALKKRAGDEAQHCLTHSKELRAAFGLTRRPFGFRLTKFVAKPSDTDIKLRLTTFYPSLKSDLFQLRYIVRSNSVMREGVSMDNNVVTHFWDRFNAIKNRLMPLGYGEYKTSKFISKVCFKQGVGVCELTKQIVPNVFLVPLLERGAKNTIMANYYVLQTFNGEGRMQRRRYDFSKNSSYVVECPITDEDWYTSGVRRNHKYNVLSYLSYRSMPNENIKVYGQNRTYRPVPYMGIELEVERKGDWKMETNGSYIVDEQGRRQHECPEGISENVYNLLGKDYVILKHDGSLGGHLPFEIVTVPATLQYHQSRWKKFLDDKEYKPHLQSYRSGQCGMHVHISRDSFNGLHLAKFMRFINSKDNYNFITKVAQRTSNSYSKYQEHSIKGHLNDIHGGEAFDRRTAVNCTNTNTVEVRIFRGNLSKVAFLKNLEFVHAAWAYTKDAGMTDLNYKDFLFWLFDGKNDTKFYKHLKVWLISAGFNVSNNNIEKTCTEQEVIKLKEECKQIKKIQLIVNRKYKPKESQIKFGSDKLISKDEILESA